MKRKLFSFLLVILVLLSAAMPAYADVIWEPEDSFYQKHVDECTYVGRKYELAGYDGNVTIWDAPGSVVSGEYPNGTQGWVQFTWSDSNVIWGYIYGLGGKVDDGWVPMDDLTLVYDSEEFFKEHKAEITETDQVPVDFHSAVLYLYPGGPTGGILEEDADYMTFSESFSAVYTDADGLHWGYVTYYMGSRDAWVCIDDPQNAHLDTAVVPVEPSQAQLRGSQTVIPGILQRSPLLLAGALVVLVVIVTALIIRRVYPKKKRTASSQR